MEDVFCARYAGDPDDVLLVERARAGQKDAVEALIAKHQQWIYNVALRMVGNSDDARDVTQETLIKIVTRLASFEGRSRFRTWLYRIVVNHVLTMKRKPWERYFYSFERHAGLIEHLGEPGTPDARGNAVDERLLLEETRTGCMTGMLLCLDRRERMSLILSTFFEADSAFGGELLETSPENYRQILSRARKRLGNFMNDRCGMMNEANPCRCESRIQGAMRAGLVDPQKLRFNLPRLGKVRDFVKEKAPLLEEAVQLKLQGLLRDLPIYTSPDFHRVISLMLKRGEIGEIVGFRLDG
jgi:RNA polymerase sigma factor (sigma-70 family)